MQLSQKKNGRILVVFKKLKNHLKTTKIELYKLKTVKKIKVVVASYKNH